MKSTSLSPERANQSASGSPDALPASMRAIVQDRYGSEDVLQLRSIPLPEVGPREVLVRVRAAGLDRGVWHLMAGLPYLVRLGFGLRAPKDPVCGLDVAGRVVGLGSEVDQFALGDEVYGICSGSFAEFASVPVEKLAPRPSNLSLEQAAAVPVSGTTALQGLRDKGNLQPGQKVLILGASGGVGSFAVQIARAMGAEVTAVCSAAKAELVRALGAEHVIDYRTEDFWTRGESYDVILDVAGNHSLGHLRRALTRRGTLVITGGEGGDRWLGGTDRQLRALALSPFVSQSLRCFIADESAQSLRELTELIEAGEVKPVIDREFPLEQVPQAMRYLLDGQARGKLVISVEEQDGR
ncbi:MAG: NADPH:quinone reductase-like Zn-dependent oxidoreductase [Planctomycetota bacterium]|jgi:NADPH:quinone reductase-like Zn-dependent oxidoreductase